MLSRQGPPVCTAHRAQPGLPGHVLPLLRALRGSCDALPRRSLPGDLLVPALQQGCTLSLHGSGGLGLQLQRVQCSAELRFSARHETKAAGLLAV